MIVIKRIREPRTQLFCSAGNITNQLQLNDVRLQIKEQQLEGYYIKYKDITIRINKYGELSEWPAGFYDKATKQLNELFGI